MLASKYFNKNMRSWIGNLLFLGLLLLLLFNPSAKAWLLQQLLAVGLFKAEIKKEAPAINTPAFSFRNERGEVVSTSDLEGRVVFINFWATWCPPCRAEMPALQELYKQFASDNRIVFLFLSEDEDLEKAKTYWQKNRFTMPLLSVSGNVPVEIYSGTLPTTVVLNKEGKIVFKQEGIARYNTTAFYEQLRSLL
ncbi:TlpA family protein disulfide reductase [Flavisolibacter sp. BT320]|nr:TlpA family protein disulfide reductase [Flavisolibacter longurius]